MVSREKSLLWLYGPPRGQRFGETERNREAKRETETQREREKWRNKDRDRDTKRQRVRDKDTERKRGVKFLRSHFYP